jgi:hypothetical protein
VPLDSSLPRTLPSRDLRKAVLYLGARDDFMVLFVDFTKVEIKFWMKAGQHIPNVEPYLHHIDAAIHKYSEYVDLHKLRSLAQTQEDLEAQLERVTRISPYCI